MANAYSREAISARKVEIATAGYGLSMMDVEDLAMTDGVRPPRPYWAASLH